MTGSKDEMIVNFAGESCYWGAPFRDHIAALAECLFLVPEKRIIRVPLFEGEDIANWSISLGHGRPI